MRRKWWYFVARLLEVRAGWARWLGRAEAAEALAARAEENYQRIDALPGRGSAEAGDPAQEASRG